MFEDAFLDFFEAVVVVGQDLAGAGDVDLQARNIAFNNFTFLKENEARAGYRTLLWRTAKGAHVALFPNLNANDPVWRTLLPACCAAHCCA